MFDPADNTFQPLFVPAEGVMITDLVAAQPRAPQAVILDKVPVLDFDPDLQREGVGILDIRSVYDFDGTDRALPDAPNIATLANPALRTAGPAPRALPAHREAGVDRRRRPGLSGPRQRGFGTVNFMREILGYVPIEPDGSVQVRVPANVAFVISVLDRDGRRLFPAHRNWLQLRPGETRRCNGCHQAARARRTAPTAAMARQRFGLGRRRRRRAIPGDPGPFLAEHRRDHGAGARPLELPERQLPLAAAERRCASTPTNGPSQRRRDVRPTRRSPTPMAVRRA